VRVEWARDIGGLSVLALLFGSGNGLSEVPVFRDQPAALDSESPLIAFPGPFSVGRCLTRGRPRR
jgi:hypothetical protein